MFKINILGTILISLTTILYSCSKQTVTPIKSNYRDVFVGKWNFNGKRVSSSDTYYKSNDIVNYVGTITKSSTSDKGIIIEYLNGYQNEFDIDSLGVISSFGVELGKIINKKTLNISWETKSDGGLSGNSTTTDVYLTGVKL